MILPERNGADFEDVPQEVRDAMTFHLAATITDVLRWALRGEESATAEFTAQVRVAGGDVGRRRRTSTLVFFSADLWSSRRAVSDRGRSASRRPDTRFATLRR